MRTIYRYLVPPDAPFHQELCGWLCEVSMPEGAKVIHVGTRPTGDDGEAQGQIWALVDPDRAAVLRTFLVLDTGRVIPDGWEYVGTFMLMARSIVCHLFERSEG